MIPTLAGVAACALLTALGYIIKKLGDLDTKITVVEAQHQNNGGATMKDAVDRIERKMDATGERLSDHLIEAARDHEQFRSHVSQCSPTVVVNQQAAPPAAPQ